MGTVLVFLGNLGSPDMSDNSIPLGGEGPFFDQPKTTPDSTGAASPSESSQTLSRPSSAHGERSARGNHRVRFGSGEALDDLNNRYTFILRSPDETLNTNLPQAPLPVAHTPPVTLTSPNNSSSGRIYSQTEYFTSPIEVDSIDIPTGEKSPPLKTLPRAYSFWGGDELEMDEKYDQFHMGKEQLSSKERAARLSKAGSFSAPNSAQASPVLNPLNTYSVGTGQVQGGVPVDDIPLLDLRDDIADTGDKDSSKKTERPKVTATKEAHDLVRQHTQRGIRPLQARASTGEPLEPRSGAVTPVAHQHEDYVKAPEQFRGGILSSLLKLYNPPAHANQTPSHHNYAPIIASPAGSPTTSGRTTPKWYNKSANTSTTSLGGLLAASGSALVTPAAGISTGKKAKHRPHSGGVVGALKNLSRPNLEEEIKVGSWFLFCFFCRSGTQHTARILTCCHADHYSYCGNFSEAKVHPKALQSFDALWGAYTSA